MKSIAVVILNYKGWHDSLNCLESLLSQDHENFRIILIDNYSENESVQKFKEYLNGDLKLKSEYFRHEPEQKKETILNIHMKNKLIRIIYQKKNYLTKI